PVAACRRSGWGGRVPPWRASTAGCRWARASLSGSSWCASAGRGASVPAWASCHPACRRSSGFRRSHIANVVKCHGNGCEVPTEAPVGARHAGEFAGADRRTSSPPAWRAPTPRSAPAFQLLCGAVAGFGFREFRLGPREVGLVGDALQCFFGALLRGKGGRLVELFAAQRSVRENGNEVRLDLQHAAGDVEKV